MEVAKVRFRGCGRHPYWRRLQNEGSREGQGDLKLIPALQLDLVLKRDVKAKNRRAAFQCKENRSLLRDVFRPARAIDCECCISPLPDFARHFCQRPESSAGTGSARGAITESSD